MISKNDVSRKSLEQAEVDIMAWQTMLQLSSGDTLELNGASMHLMKMLRERASKLTGDESLKPESKNDWLALALFAEDRRWFVEACEQAERDRDIPYLRARNWLKQIVEKDKRKLGN